MLINNSWKIERSITP